MAEEPVAVEVARITIIRELDVVDGDSLSVGVEPADVPLMVALGMLRLAEDTVLQTYADREEGR